MPFIPAANTARVVVNMDWNFQRVQNVYHVLNGGAWSEASLTSLAGVFIAWMNDSFAPITSDTVQYSHVTVRDLTELEGLGVEVGFPPLSGGDLVGAGVPGNVTVAVKHVTGRTGRSRRGRTFIVGTPQGAIVGNQINSGFQDAIQAAFEALRADILAAGFTWVVASFYSGTTGEGEPIPRVTAQLTPITGITVDVNLDSQRRRLTGRGT